MHRVAVGVRAQEAVGGGTIFQKTASRPETETRKTVGLDAKCTAALDNGAYYTNGQRPKGLARFSGVHGCTDDGHFRSEKASKSAQADGHLGPSSGPPHRLLGLWRLLLVPAPGVDREGVGHDPLLLLPTLLPHRVADPPQRSPDNPHGGRP